MISLENKTETIDKDENKNLLFLKIKISKNSLGNFDKSKIEKEYNILLDDRTYLLINRNNIILKIESQIEANLNDGEILLFNVRKNRNNTFQLEKPLYKNLPLSENNINDANYYFWYVIKSDIANRDNINDDYYLNENDIIRFSNVKLILKEIHFLNKKYEISSKKLNYDLHKININKRGPIFILEPNLDNYITKKEDILTNDNILCDLCNQSTYSEDNPLIKLCMCEKYKHYECIKQYIKKIIRKIPNNDQTSINYYIKFFCTNNCREIYPLRFKLGNNNKIYKLFEIDKPKNEEYLIFESLPYIKYYNEIERSIHLVRLTGNNNNIEIKIGRDGHKKDNHIKLEEETVSRKHAKIIYNKKIKSLLLKNISERSETLVLIKDILKINENKIHIHIGRISIEACLINEKDSSNIEKYKIQTKKEYIDEINQQISNNFSKSSSTNITQQMEKDKDKDLSNENFFDYK